MCSWKHCSICMKGAALVKMSSAVTVTSMLTYLNKGIFFVDKGWGESSRPSSTAIVTVVTIAFIMKKDLRHHNTALSPLSYLTLVVNSSLLLILTIQRSGRLCWYSALIYSQEATDLRRSPRYSFSLARCLGTCLTKQMTNTTNFKLFNEKMPQETQLCYSYQPARSTCLLRITV